MSAQCRAGVRYKPRITIRHQCFRQDRLTSKEAQAVRIRSVKDSSNGTLASARMLPASFRPSDSGNFAVTQAQFGLISFKLSSYTAPVQRDTVVSQNRGA